MAHQSPHVSDVTRLNLFMFKFRAYLKFQTSDQAEHANSLDGINSKLFAAISSLFSSNKEQTSQQQHQSFSQRLDELESIFGQFNSLLIKIMTVLTEPKVTTQSENQGDIEAEINQLILNFCHSKDTNNAQLQNLYGAPREQNDFLRGALDRVRKLKQLQVSLKCKENKNVKELESRLLKCHMEIANLNNRNDELSEDLEEVKQKLKVLQQAQRKQINNSISNAHQTHSQTNPEKHQLSNRSTRDFQDEDNNRGNSKTIKDHERIKNHKYTRQEVRLSKQQELIGVQNQAMSPVFRLSPPKASRDQEKDHHQSRIQRQLQQQINELRTALNSHRSIIEGMDSRLKSCRGHQEGHTLIQLFKLVIEKNQGLNRAIGSLSAHHPAGHTDFKTPTKTSSGRPFSQSNS